MKDEYVDPEFPEMEVQPEEFSESEGNPEPKVWDEEFYGEIPVPDEFQEQMDSEWVESPSDAQDVVSVPEYSPKEVSQTLSQDSGGSLFLPDDDPIQQPPINEPLDPQLVYTRFVPRRLRHLVSERRQPEYHRPAGLYRPGL
jgi:hypothetical protein